MTKCVFIKREVFNLDRYHIIPFDSIIPITHVLIALIRVKGSSRAVGVRRSLRLVVRSEKSVLLNIPFEAMRLVELFQTNFSSRYCCVMSGFYLTGKWCLELYNDSRCPLHLRVSAFSITHRSWPIIIDLPKL